MSSAKLTKVLAKTIRQENNPNMMTIEKDFHKIDIFSPETQRVNV